MLTVPGAVALQAFSVRCVSVCQTGTVCVCVLLSRHMTDLLNILWKRQGVVFLRCVNSKVISFL